MTVPCKWFQEFKQVWINGPIRREQILASPNAYGFWFLRPFPANIPKCVPTFILERGFAEFPPFGKKYRIKFALTCLMVCKKRKKKLCPMLRTYYVNQSVHKHHWPYDWYDYHYVLSNLWPLFFLPFFFHLPFSSSSTKISLNKRGIRNNWLWIERSKTKCNERQFEIVEKREYPSSK